MKEKSQTKKNVDCSKKEYADYLSSLTTTKTNSKTLEKAENLWSATDAVEFASKKLGIKLDDWQKKYIETKGNVAVRAGRQSGKSFAQSLRVALFALLNKNTQTLVIGAVDRQSVELFEKIKTIISELAKHTIKGRPTQHRIELRNGSKIIAHPAGRTGYGLRGFAINKLVADEAHYIPEEVWTAVRPMLATTRGTMDLLSTPRGNSGFFYEAFKSNEFTTYHVTSEECPRISKEFLKEERKRMTKLQYAQEYLAEFLDNLQQFFPRLLIDECTIKPGEDHKNSIAPGVHYMGVDVARYGGDENAYVIAKLNQKGKLEVVYIETTEKVSTADTIGRIQALTDEFNIRKVFIDDGGIGGAVLDVLLEKPKIKRKVIGINNASRSIEADKSRGKRILKEDLYGNLRRMMEQKEIKLPDNDKLRLSLMSIQFEYTDNKFLKIFGKYSHITEALIRASWCVKAKGLNIYIA